MERVPSRKTVIRPPNVLGVRQAVRPVPRAEAGAARQLPPMTVEEPSGELQPP